MSSAVKKDSNLEFTINACAWCGRVKENGKWKKRSLFYRETPTHCICKSCLKKYFPKDISEKVLGNLNIVE
jgi:hypothetical protein